jgi:predicted translin family RNA/ssDNA-binding protein
MILSTSKKDKDPNINNGAIIIRKTIDEIESKINGLNSIIQDKKKEVEKIKGVINDIMSELVEFDMTGYLRTKYDQARGNLRKIEQINYEVKIRK